MKILWITVGLILFINSSLGDDTDGLIKFLNNEVPGLLIGVLKKLEVMKLNDTSLTPKGALIKGYLNLTNIQLSGLGNVDSSIKNIYAEKASNASYADISVRLPISNIELSLNYDMDLGIIDKIPLYGEGKISISIQKIDVRLQSMFLCDNCHFLLNYYVPTKAENLSLSLFVRHNKPYITGIFRHSEADKMVSLIMNLAEQFICMWFDYNAECLDCIVSPFIARILNNVFNAANGKPDDKTLIAVDCVCLQGMLPISVGNISPSLKQ